MDLVLVTRSRLNNQLNDLTSGARIGATRIGDRLHEAAHHPQAALNKAMAAMPVGTKHD